MGFDRYIEIGHVDAAKADSWGAVDPAAAGVFVVDEPTWAMVTADGGGENKQGAAIVSSNTVVFSIRYVPGITEDKVIRYNDRLYNIVYIGEEGRNKLLHLKAEVKR